MTDTVPLTPPDCDLRDFQFMPLDVGRLRDSDLAALESPEACWAAVQLWGASWHQVPAASLPDDDRVLAQLSGYGRVVKEWLKVKKGALRHFIKCSDGRLYHPIVAEKAIEAWQGKLEQRWRTECARIKKRNQRLEENASLPTLDEFLASRPGIVPKDAPVVSPGTDHQRPSGQIPLSPECPPGNGVQGTGKGTGTGTGNSSEDKSSGANAPVDFGKEAWDRAIRILTGAGLKEPKARGLFGRLLKDNGLEARDLLPAITSAAVNGTGDPAAYLTKAAQGVARRRGSPVDSGPESRQDWC